MVNNKLTYNHIIKNIGAGLCLIDRNFRVVWVNKYYVKWFGPTSKIYGKHCYEVFECRKHICRGCPTKKVFKTGTIHTAVRTSILTRDGQRGHYHLTVSPIKSNHNKVEFALELAQDITRQAKKEMRNRHIIGKLKRAQKLILLANQRLRSNMLKVKSLAERIYKLKQNIKKEYNKKALELKRAKDELFDIFKITRSITSTISPKKIFSLITRYACELIEADVSILWLTQEHKNNITAASSFGLYKNVINNNSFFSNLRFNLGVSGKVAKLKKPVKVYDIYKEFKGMPDEIYKVLRQERCKSIVAVPVLFQDKLLGVLTVYSRRKRDFKKDEIELLSIFASEVALAIQESKYYEDIHVSYFDTIHALVLALEARDPYTRGHTERVTKYALTIAKRMDMSEEELEILRYAGETHDIGKISIPDFILNKPGRLTPAERVVIELHPVKGTEMLESLAFLRPALPSVKHHHERYDGTGYPDGLEKDNIPLMARILACADAFDAMTSDRPYRNRKLTIQEALVELKNNSGSQFDPHIVATFVKIIKTVHH